MANSSDAIIITGSSGLIGSALAKKLSKSHKVVGFDKNTPKSPIENVDYYEVNITSDENVRATLGRIERKYGKRITSAIHLAAYYSFSGEEDPKYDEITVRGTERLLRELKRFELEQFIFSSTMLVHAPTTPGKEINESSPLDPRWPYPQSKVDAEESIGETHGRVPIVNLRIAGVYTDRCNSIPIANHIMRIYERQLTSHFFPGDPSHGQAFLHLDDLVDAIEKVVDRRKALPQECTILLGEPDALSFNDLQEEIGCLIHGEDWKTLWIPQIIAKAGAAIHQRIPLMREPFIKPWMISFADDHYDINIERARKLLNWEPRHSLRKTLPLMIEALKKDSARWYRENKLEPPGQLFRLTKRAFQTKNLGFIVAAFAGFLAYKTLKRRPITAKPESRAKGLITPVPIRPIKPMVGSHL
ncbi:MAG: NAD(P)-dependent oxidoreductase [Bdellovibrionota bacterium]